MDKKTGENYALWNTRPLSTEEFTRLPSEKKLEHLLTLAHLAPSTHNTQPWRFKIDSNAQTVHFLMNKNSILPASDKKGRQTAISVGSSIENFCVGADFFDVTYDLHINDLDKESILETDDKNVQIASAKMHFEGGGKNNGEITDSLYKSIFSRKVMRSEYDPEQSISNDIENSITVLNNLYKNVSIHLVRDKVRKKAVSEFQGQADSFVMNSKKFSRELGEWLLPNETQSGIGMPGSGFGLGDDQAKRIHNGLLGTNALEPEDALKFALVGKNHIEKSPLLIFICTKNDTMRELVLAGRILERCLLLLESQNISTAIHAGISEVSLINKMFSISLGVNDKIAILFRAGYLKNASDKERPHSPRLPISQVIL